MWPLLIPLLTMAAEKQQKDQENYKPKGLDSMGGAPVPVTGPGSDPVTQSSPTPGSVMGPTAGGPAGPQSVGPFDFGATFSQRLAGADQDRAFGESLMGGGLPQGRMAGGVFIPPGPGEMALSILPKILGWKMMQGARGAQSSIWDKMDDAAPKIHKAKLAERQAARDAYDAARAKADADALRKKPAGSIETDPYAYSEE